MTVAIWNQGGVLGHADCELAHRDDRGTQAVECVRPAPTPLNSPVSLSFLLSALSETSLRTIVQALARMWAAQAAVRLLRQQAQEERLALEAMEREREEREWRARMEQEGIQRLNDEEDNGRVIAQNLEFEEVRIVVGVVGSDHVERTGTWLAGGWVQSHACGISTGLTVHFVEPICPTAMARSIYLGGKKGSGGEG